MVQHTKEVLKGVLRQDGGIDAMVIRLEDSGAKDKNYPLFHGLGRVPVGCQIILKDKTCDVYKGTRWDATIIDMKFTAANADLNIRIW